MKRRVFMQQINVDYTSIPLEQFGGVSERIPGPSTLTVTLIVPNFDAEFYRALSNAINTGHLGVFLEVMDDHLRSVIAPPPPREESLDPREGESLDSILHRVNQKLDAIKTKKDKPKPEMIRDFRFEDEKT
jgi:hypothetical protein